MLWAVVNCGVGFESEREVYNCPVGVDERVLLPQNCLIRHLFPSTARFLPDGIALYLRLCILATILTELFCYDPDSEHCSALRR